MISDLESSAERGSKLRQDRTRRETQSREDKGEGERGRDATAFVESRKNYYCYIPVTVVVKVNVLGYFSSYGIKEVDNLHNRSHLPGFSLITM